VCAGCQSCVSICPHHIWQPAENGTVKIDVKAAEKCTMDYECVRVCPSGAIEIRGKV
jgi:pyruvate kinase